MRKLVQVVLALFLMVCVSAVAFAGAKGEFAAKAGDPVYVCPCGSACGCGTLSHKQAKCGCGKKLVKATVTRAEDGKVYYQVKGEELAAPVEGAYVCGCGEGCNCGTVSQKPGKCACGKDLVKVKKM